MTRAVGDTRTSSWREYRQAAVVFALMILVFFWPLLLQRVLSQADVLYFFLPWLALKPPDLIAPSNPVLSDQTREFLSFFYLARESLHQGAVPLWNPYILAGTPLLANSQSALLFPLNWPFYLFPLHLGFTISALLKMAIASLATYAFARTLSLSHMAALLAGTAYAFSAFNVFWLNHPHTNVTIFLPLLLLCAEWIKENPTTPLLAGLGLTVGGQLLGGHVELAFHIAVAVSLFFLFRLIERGGQSAWLPRAWTFLCGYTLGFLLAGILVIPFLEFLSQSATWQVRSDANPFTVHPLGLLTLFLPIAGWTPLDLSFYHGFSLYVGICPLALALLLFAYRPQKVSFCFVGLSLFALAVAFGLPPFFSLLTSLPLFKQAPNWYMVIFCAFSVSLLGGMGLDCLLDGKSVARRYQLAGAVAVCILPVSALGGLWLVRESAAFSAALQAAEARLAFDVTLALTQLSGSLARSLLFAGFTCVLLTAVWKGWVPRRLLGGMVIGLTFTDLFLAGAGWNPMIPSRWTVIPTPPAVAFLQQDPTLYRVAGIGPVMPPNTATFCGLQDIRGYDVPVERRYHTFFQAALDGRVEWWRYELPALAAKALPFFSLLNVKYLLSRDPLPPPLSLVYDKEIKIYKNPDVFPRAFLVHRAEIVHNAEAALARVLALGPELQGVAILEEPLPATLQARFSMATSSSQAGSVRVISYTAQRVEVQVETPTPGLLLLGDVYFPGWEAYVDGQKAALYRANYLLRAVVVGAGSQRVVFLYRPLSFRIGLGLTGVAGVILLWCLKQKQGPRKKESSL